jgi:ribosomal protein L2
MGHRITTQNRGRGGPTYRAPSHRYKAELRHLGDGSTTVTGSVIDIEHDPARNAPIAVVRLEDGTKSYMLITEGVGVGTAVAWGADVEVKNGNTLPLGNIPSGSYICNMAVNSSALPVFRLSLLTRLRTGSVSGCPVAKQNGSVRNAGQQSVSWPEADVLKNRS